MIKGVNKNVIEISETGHDLFERAILFVRPDSGQNSDHLRSRAAEYLAGLKMRPLFFRRRVFWFGMLKFAVAAVAGAALFSMFIK